MRLNAMMQNSRALIFNHCGHWAQIEHADEFNWLLDNFIAHNP
jgi:2-hydroxy-6-oxonona-2,4-dienedioate hydrolase